jgi:hypothetical protein
LIFITLLAAQCAFVTWVIRDRQRLIRERNDAIQKQRQLIEALQKWAYYYGITKAAESGTQRQVAPNWTTTSLFTDNPAWPTRPHSAAFSSAASLRQSAR